MLTYHKKICKKTKSLHKQIKKKKEKKRKKKRYKKHRDKIIITFFNIDCD